MARVLADSLAYAMTASPAEQAAGLYWHGLLARAPRERRLAFARVLVEFPLTSTAGDALYRIAQLDLAAGDRTTAQRHLQRVVRDYGTSSTSADAAYELGQMLMADGNAREGCAALDSAIQWTALEQVEKRNRASYARRPCAVLAVEPPRDSMTPSPEPAAGRAWSAQVGAFASKADAERIVSRLAARGYEARITTDRPFRVRIGRFATRAAAAAIVAKLKGERTTAILVEAERP